MANLRLLVADDHDVLRRGVRLAVENHPDWKVVAEARDGREAIQKSEEFTPDVAILDYSMPLNDGLEVTREILRTRPNTKVLILTVHDSDVLIQQTREAGAHGYIRKVDAERDLISAIKALVSNQNFYPPKLTTDFPQTNNCRKAQSRLTTRQKEIVRLLAEGLRTDKIAGRLGISPNTVEKHRHNILLRTNCNSTAELVRYAIRNGIINA